jgi:hypothetical protein
VSATENTQDIGGAVLQSSSRALASEAVSEDLAGRAQGFMTTAHHVGLILGPGSDNRECCGVRGCAQSDVRRGDFLILAAVVTSALRGAEKPGLPA